MALFFFKFELNIPDNPTVGFLQSWCRWKDFSKANPTVAISGKSDGRISRYNRLKSRFQNTNCSVVIRLNIITVIYIYIYINIIVSGAVFLQIWIKHSRQSNRWIFTKLVPLERFFQSEPNGCGFGKIQWSDFPH